jgi:hypothetical protein
MTRIDEAEQIFRRLNVKNRAALLGRFKAALKAENSIKKSLDLAPRPNRDRKNAAKGRDGQEAPGRAHGTG